MSDQQVQQLLDQGLTNYGLGQLKEAIACWRQVLAIDPGNTRAREYLDFVQSNWGPQGYRPGGGNNRSPEEPPGGRGEPALPDSAFSRPPPGQQPPAPSPGGYQPPVAVAGWGNLFDLDERGTDSQPLDRDAPPAPKAGPAGPTAEPPAGPAPAMETAAAEPVEKAVPAEAGSSSTLPPHPQQQHAPPTPASDNQHSSTRLYESVPTVVRPPTAEAAATSAPATPTTPAAVALPAAAPSSHVEAGGGGDALDLVAGTSEPTTQPASVPSDGDGSAVTLQGIRDLMELDDFSGAIELIDKLLAQEPDNEAARQLRTEAEQQLLAMYASKLGRLEQVPRVRIAQDELIWLNLDHRAGFILSLIDGRTSYDEIISVCGLPVLDAMRLLVQLLQENVIEVS